MFASGGGTEKARLDSSGDLALGSTSVSNPNGYGRILNVAGFAPALVLSETDTGKDFTIGVNGNQLRIFDETTTRVTLGSTGSLLIGKDNETFSNAGIEARANGNFRAIRDGGNTADFNRLTSDGNIAAFYKDGTAKAVIGSVYTGFGTGSPATPLHVYHATINKLLTLQSGDGTSARELKDDAGAALVQEFNGVLNLVTNNNSDGTSQIRFSDGATELARIDSNGRLGIGTTVPSQPLDVRAAENIQLKLASTTASNNARMVFAPNNSEKWNMGVNISNNDFTFYDVATGTSPVRFEDGAASNTLVVDTNSRVGIGTTSPDRLLDIEGSVPAVRLTDTTTTGMYHEILGDGNSLSIEADDGNVGSNSRIQFKVDGTERARINSSGRLGLNTTNPTTDLEVNTTGANGIKITSDQPYLFFNDTDNSGTAYDSSVSFSGDSLYIGGASAASIIRFRNLASFGESVRIDTIGRLGIGTSSPSTGMHLSFGDSKAELTLERTGTNASSWGLKPYNGDFFIRESGTDRVTVKAGGLVGIGTTSPSAKLHIDTDSDEGIRMQTDEQALMLIFLL